MLLEMVSIGAELIICYNFESTCPVSVAITKPNTFLMFRSLLHARVRIQVAGVQ